MVRILQALALVVPVVAGYTFPSGFNIGLVDSNTIAGWCRAQRNTCPLICGGSALVNNCDPNDLQDFVCTCSNGTEANSAEYQQTIPYFVCIENFGQCISASSTQDGDDACEKQRDKCGALNASEISTAPSSTLSTTTLPTETGGGGSGDGAQSSPTTSQTPTATPPTDAAARLLQDNAMLVMATVMFLGFQLVL